MDSGRLSIKARNSVYCRVQLLRRISRSADRSLTPALYSGLTACACVALFSARNSLSINDISQGNQYKLFSSSIVMCAISHRSPDHAARYALPLLIIPVHKFSGSICSARSTDRQAQSLQALFLCVKVGGYSVIVRFRGRVVKAAL